MITTSSTMHTTNVYDNIERELCYLIRQYEARGFHHHFFLEGGSLVCGEYNFPLLHPEIVVYENRYYPERDGAPHGYYLFALTVTDACCLFKGIFLLPQGVLTQQQISGKLEQQLGLSRLCPQLFKTSEDHRDKFFPADTLPPIP
ncbi:hypothetical protein SAMN04488128_1011118 [Chitinophaga eiseniae]|uniref:Uncharacterized protein n=2 Tax=Chitinophaga eiseniae TaxID=634771 RepID=A0A1T4MI42_9BACT|nr:hypothetical protein SAMN04488128_1011118 [Chitinophaga eiseniae]